MDENNSKYRKVMALLFVVQNVGVKIIVPTSKNVMGRRRECDEKSKIDLQVQNVVLRKKCPETDFFSGLCFLLFVLNTGKYGPEKTLYLDTFYTVVVDKSNLQNTEVSTEIISSSTQQHHIVKKSLTLRRIHLHHYVSVRATSSPISGYRLIGMSILANVFMLLSWHCLFI